MGIIFSKVCRKGKRNSFRLSTNLNDQIPLPKPCPGCPNGDYDTISVYRKSLVKSQENRNQLGKFDTVHIQRNDKVRTSQRTLTSDDSGVSNSTAATRKSGAMFKHTRRQRAVKDSIHPIQYMVDVFKPVVCKYLRPSDVLSNLLFIDSTNVEKIRSKEKESAIEACEMMIEHIQRSTDPGKWQALVDALLKAEYPYLAKLLTRETEIDHFISHALLRLNFDELLHQIQIGECLDFLYENEVIQVRDKEVIEAELKCAGPISAARKLLENIHRRSEHWDDKFSEVLERCGMSELADIFQNAVRVQAQIQEFNTCSTDVYELYHDQYCTQDEEDETYIKAVNDNSQKPDNTQVIQILEKVTMLEIEVSGLKACMEKQNCELVDMKRMLQSVTRYFCDNPEPCSAHNKKLASSLDSGISDELLNHQSISGSTYF